MKKRDEVVFSLLNLFSPPLGEGGWVDKKIVKNLTLMQYFKSFWKSESKLIQKSGSNDFKILT